MIKHLKPGLVLIAICLNCAFNSTTSAQQKFRPGFIVNIEGDTIFGMINYRSDARSHRSCLFYQNNTQNTVNYLPGQITAWSIKDHVLFESHKVETNNKEKETVFLEVIGKGKASLYRFEKHIYLGREEHGIIRMNNDKEVIMLNNRKTQRQTNQYYGILTMVFNDCSDLGNAIRQVRYSEKDLTKITRKFNDCIDAPFHVSNISSKSVRIYPGFTAGYALSQIAVDLGSVDYSPMLGSFSIAHRPFIGLSFEWKFSGMMERLSFRSDAVFSSGSYFNLTVYDNSLETIRRVQTNEVTIVLSQLRFPLGVQYTVPERGWAHFYSAGVVQTFHTHKRADWIHTFDAYDIIEIYQGEAMKVRGNQHGIWLGAGFTKQLNNRYQASFEMRLEKNNGLQVFQRGNTPLRDWKQNNHYFQLGMVIRRR